MKKRIISLFLMLAILTSVIGTCFAASSVSFVDCQYKGSRTQGGKITFYVRANGSTCKLKFTCGKGKLDWDGGKSFYSSQYGSYEVKVYNPGGQEIADKDIYHRSGYTLSFSASKDKVYKIEVWNWNPRTIALSYFNHGYFENVGINASVGKHGDPNWYAFPSIKATNQSNCTLYLTKP